jgi:glycosyltransferase involved in cell wall biosynthesis
MTEQDKVKVPKQNSQHGIKVLVWVPHIAPGGGSRLMMQLLPAIANHPNVEFLKLAVPYGAFDNARYAPENTLQLKVIELTEVEEGTLRTWLEEDKRILGIKGTGKLKRVARRRLPPRVPDWTSEQLENAAQGCDLIYTFWPHHTDFPEVTKPIVCTFHDTTLFDFPEIMGASKTYLELEQSRVWVKRAARVVVPSFAIKANMVRIFGDYGASNVVINHAILPRDRHVEGKSDTDVLSKVPPRYIIFPAGTAVHKNQYMLLTAWARFQRRRECPLVFVGPHTDELNRDLASVTELWAWVRFVGLFARTGMQREKDFFALGYVNDADLMTLVKNAAGLIMPTLAEGGGSYPVEEALSLGVPVLCSDIPVMREHLAGRSAKIAWFDPESIDSMLKALNSFLDYYDEYKESAVRAMNDSRPTWDDIADQYVTVFAQVIGTEG